MICPHCSHEGPEGRRYCRACAKPLAPETTPEKTALKPALRPAAPKPLLSKMALASLILSFFSLIFPLGIAAVALGHVSRNQIAKSGGRLRGTWLAFAGLILGYLQLTLAAALFLAGVGLWLEFNQKMGKETYVRAALVERIKNGDPYKVTVADAAKHQQNAVEALRMIRARQSEYLAAHPDEGYACRLDQLGFHLTEDSELGNLITSSRYQMQIYQCRAVNELRYVVLAVPRSDFNLPNAPIYCLDSTGMIYKYSAEQSRDAVARVAGKDSELCSRDGERAEQ